MPLLMSLMVWAVMGPIIRALDPMAGTDDWGFLQALVFGLVQYYAAITFAWAALRIVFPKIGRYVDNWLGEMFELSEDTRFKMWFSLALFSVYFFGAILIFATTL